MIHAPDAPDAPIEETYDLCIIGAGLAGLNALFVASRHLSAGQRVALVDRRDRAGGMWVDAYPYVRLHQPHAMFTAGNIEWTLERPRSYLPTRSEVLEHFQHCLAVITRQLQVTEFFGWTVQSQSELGDAVRLTARSAAGQTTSIDAHRVIMADGLGVSPNPPLTLSSRNVRSVSPNTCDAGSEEIRSSTAPVWIVGGGKTAMDTAHALVQTSPRRDIRLVAGAGTYFTNRDKTFPPGARRWFGGTRTGALGAEVARRFDGTNEDEVRRWLLATHGIALTPHPPNYLLGILSGAEARDIARGLAEVITDYAVDVVDRAGGPHLVLRSGAERPVVPGSWIVNCTGYILRDTRPYEPYLSRSGRVLSIHPRSATMHLTSYAGYFLTHLFLSGSAAEAPLYELDMPALRAKSPAALPFTAMTLAQHNLGIFADALPNAALRECGLNFDRWYPWPRRAAGQLKFLLGNRRAREHNRQTLDTIRDRFSVRCGPLPAI